MIIRRYLAAFGPASVKDAQKWSGLTRLQDTFEALREELVVFRDEQGTELFDLPHAPRPAADTPAAPRFLGEFDNILLSHADRSRIMDEAYYKRVFTVNGIIRPTVLVGGFVAGTWKLQQERARVTLIIEPFRELAEQDLDALMDEGNRLIDFAAAEADSREIAVL